MIFFITGLMAVLNTLFFIASGFRKSKKEVLYFHTLCCVCDLVIYGIFGAKTGLANATANICKNLAFSRFDSMRFTILFTMLRIGLLCIGWEGLPTALFILCEIVEIFLLKYGTTQQFRYLTLFRQGVWVVYDLLFATILVSLCTMVGFIGCMTSIIKNKEKTP